ncbi:hypothetical protein CZP2022_30 [Vibrio phage C-ZP2022]|nr:hypothetical protein CZP2022_30 [Vibrio phage C-ZP2022]
MDFSVDACTARHIEHIEIDGEPCIKSNGTIITIPALIELAHYESRHDALGTVRDIEGLFLAANNAILKDKNRCGFVSLDSERRNDYRLTLTESDGDEHRYYEISCPFYCSIMVTTARGFVLEIKGVGH